MELRHYFAALWKRVPLLILAPLLAGTIDLVFNMQIEAVYRVSTTFFINPTGRATELDYSPLISVERIDKNLRQY